MNIFKRIHLMFKKPKIYENQLKQEVPIPGEIWCLIYDQEDPFGPKYNRVKIIDVKQGWVQYDMGFPFNDERMKISVFMKIYKKYVGEL